MYAFTYMHGGAETLDGLNKRLAAYCEDPANPVIGVVVSEANGLLMVSCTAPEDVPFPASVALRPTVLVCKREDFASLEVQLDKLLDDLRKADTEATLLETAVYPCGPDALYIVVKAVIGTLEDAAPEGE